MVYGHGRQNTSCQQRVSNIALPQAQHKATSPTRKPLGNIKKRETLTQSKFRNK